MLITADIGNTHSVFGLWEGRRLLDTCRLNSSRERTPFEWSTLLEAWLRKQPGRPARIVTASVVPGLDDNVEESMRLIGVRDCIRLTHESPLPFTFDYTEKHTLGADRIANVIAAVRFHSDNAIIVDFGTAITFCVVEQGVYRGGVIAPGIHSSMNALFQKTAKLPRISFAHCSEALGKSTVESIQAGAFFGWKGLVREILGLLRAEFSPGREICRIATGGISEDLIYAHEFFNVIDRNLTLRGLMVLAEDHA